MKRKTFTFFAFPRSLHPLSAQFFPLVQREQYEKVAKDISKSLTKAQIRHKSDFTASSSSIGKKYVRPDQLGVPFVITVDLASSVIRERDSNDQIRVNVEDAVAVVKMLAKGSRTWAEVWSTFPHMSSEN